MEGKGQFFENPPRLRVSLIAMLSVLRAAGDSFFVAPSRGPSPVEPLPPLPPGRGRRGDGEGQQQRRFLFMGD